MLRVLGTGSARQRQKRCAQCLRPVTADGIPIVGRLPGCSNGYIAVGHGAVGIQLSPVTGLAIAELITSGECTSCDLACFDLMRFAETVRRGSLGGNCGTLVLTRLAAVNRSRRAKGRF